MTSPVKSPGLIGEVGPFGIRICLDALIKRVGVTTFKKILRVLTITEIPQPGRPAHIGRMVRKAYYMEKDPITKVEYVYFPRIKGADFIRAKVISDRSVVYKSVNIRTISEKSALFSPPDPLYSYQEATVEYLCNTIFGDERKANHSSTGYLEMGPGLGKTRTSVAVICRKRVPTIVSVPTIAIGEQWLEELADSCPNLKCAFYKNPPKNSKKVPPNAKTHDVIVCVINTLREKKPEFVRDFGMVILDEAHELHSAHNGEVLWLAQTNFVLGLSGSPLERKDGLDRYVSLHLGKVIRPSDIPGFDASDATFTGEVWKIEYAGHPDYIETGITSAGTASSILTINNVRKDPHRLKLVIDLIIELYTLHQTNRAAKYGLVGAKQHGVFVFAEHREELPNLREAIHKRLEETKIDPNSLLVPELESETFKKSSQNSRKTTILRGGVHKSEVGAARKARSHIVLTTYGYSRRGISLPDMTAAVWVSPRRSGIGQLIGRVERRGSDQSIVRVIVDIVDVRTGLKKQATDRMKAYKAKGYKVFTRKVSYESIDIENIIASDIRDVKDVDLGVLTELEDEKEEHNAFTIQDMEEVASEPIGAVKIGIDDLLLE